MTTLTFIIAAQIALVLLAMLSTLVPRTYHLLRYRHLKNGLGAVRFTTWVKSAAITLFAAYALVGLLRPDLVNRFPALRIGLWGLLDVGAVGVAVIYWRTVRLYERRIAEQHNKEEKR